MFATYVHHFDPVALKVGFLSLRWYGLAYLGGFAAGYFLLRHLAQRKMWALKPEETGDFIAAAALFGVFMGGRLGYVLFYQVLDSNHGWQTVLRDPLAIFRVWEGGMASHGGILGLVIFTWVYARRKKVSWTGLGDGLCVVAPVGLFFGRIANFINGELYGRVATGVSWAIKFPMALRENRIEAENFGAAANAVSKVVPGLMMSPDGRIKENDEIFMGILEASRSSPEARAALEPYLEPRHPSQLYEAALEGALLFTILWMVRIKFPKAPHGLLTGLFFGIYAAARSAVDRRRRSAFRIAGGW